MVEARGAELGLALLEGHWRPLGHGRERGVRHRSLLGCLLAGQWTSFSRCWPSVSLLLIVFLTKAIDLA